MTKGIFDDLLPTTRGNQKLIVPEVVQTSAMDCGPAALKAVLEGFGTSVSYGRLREACQTTVDGTSINVLAQVAAQLGLDAQQTMLPADFLLLDSADALPAIVVMRLPSGMTHFVVVWSFNGGFVQVMNPASGRRWMRRQAFIDELYVHTHPVSAETWRAWAGDEGFVKPLTERLHRLGVGRRQIAQLHQSAQADASWFGYAALDATIRLTDSLVRADAIDKGTEAAGVIEQLFNDACANPAQAFQAVPQPFWYVAADAADRSLLQMRGVVMLAIDGARRPDSAETELAPELAAALVEKEPQPFWEIWRLLRADGFTAPALLLLTTVLASLGVVFEILLLRGVMSVGDEIIGLQQRINAVAILIGFGVLMVLIEFVFNTTLSKMGRHLDTRLRIAFLSKIPRLHDRYFQSRLMSDMTMRAHELATVYSFPALGARFLRLTVQLLLTTLGVIAFVPQMAGVVLFVMLVALLPSIVMRPVLQEQDLRYRSHTGGLSRFYLDGLLGLLPLRSHSAENAFHNAHEMLLTEWYHAGRSLHNANLWVRGLQSLLSIGSVIFILTYFINSGGDLDDVLILFFWALNLPVLGQRIATIVMQYPQLRNRVLRLLEPLNAPEEAPEESAISAELVSGPTVTLQNVTVIANGSRLLKNVTTTIAAGEHVAIIGASGAGKSTLMHTLLGLHKPADGALLINGQPLDVAALRQQTVWVDPTVHLWNRTLKENLEYGNGRSGAMSYALDQADLYDVLERMPDGFQTPLGENGGLVSGGEGQRVRFGRGLLRPDARLVILDEPFRGLDRCQRRALLQKARRLWQDATLLFVSHDVAETQAFDRVLLLQHGRIAEDGTPATLLARPDSSYARLLQTESIVQRRLWQSEAWRRLRIKDGELVEACADDTPALVEDERLPALAPS